jgi:hypothetical protein
MSKSAMGQFFSGLVKGLGIVITGGVVIFYTVEWSRRSEAKAEAELEARLTHLKPLEDQLYAMVTGTRSPAPMQTRLSPDVVFLTVTKNRRGASQGDRYARTIDPLTLELPDTLFPATQGDVRTIVALNWSEEVVGEYEANPGMSPQDACIEKCYVEVWDMESRAPIVAESFVGGEPPKAVPANYRASAVYGDRCDKQILQYVDSLFTN